MSKARYFYSIQKTAMATGIKLKSPKVSNFRKPNNRSKSKLHSSFNNDGTGISQLFSVSQQLLSLRNSPNMRLNHKRVYNNNVLNTGNFKNWEKSTIKDKRYKKSKFIAGSRTLRRLEPSQLKNLNHRFSIKWWNNYRFNVNKLDHDLYWSIRKVLVRKNIGTALSPYFYSLLNLNIKSNDLWFPELDSRSFSSFGYRTTSYVLLKRKWNARLFSYRYHLQRVMDAARKYKFVCYVKTFIKKSNTHRTLLREISNLEQFCESLEERKSKILKPLNSNSMLLGSYYSQFDASGLFEYVKPFLNSGFSSNILVSYFMSTASNKLHYNIFRHPIIYIFRREYKKYSYFIRQLEVDMQERLLSQFHACIPIFVIKPCVNNLVIYVYKKGQLIFSLSAGMTLKNKNDSRRTNFAKFNTLHAACAKLTQLGINSVDLKLLSGSIKHMRKFYRTFFRKRGVIVRNLLFAARNAHNGLRLKKARRV